jgi:hypothetical protein
MTLEIEGMTPQEIQQAMNNINVLPKSEQKELLALLDELEKKEDLTKRQGTFLEFVDHVYSGYKVGDHHRKLAQLFEDIANGKKETSYRQHCSSTRESANSFRTWRPRGFWVSTRHKKGYHGIAYSGPCS